MICMPLLENPVEKCCNDIGVPSECIGFCRKKRVEPSGRGPVLGICESWLERIGECRDGK